MSRPVLTVEQLERLRAVAAARLGKRGRVSAGTETFVTLAREWNLDDKVLIRIARGLTP
jgi:hypothetical protein